MIEEANKTKLGHNLRSYECDAIRTFYMQSYGRRLGRAWLAGIIASVACLQAEQFKATRLANCVPINIKILIRRIGQRRR